MQNDLSPPSFSTASDSISRKFQSKNYQQTCGSTISAARIHQYFGRVDHHFASEELPCDDVDSVITKMLKHFTDYDALSVSCLNEFKAIINKYVPPRVNEDLDDMSRVYTILLDRVLVSCDQNVRRKAFYHELFESIGEIRKENPNPYSYQSLKNLKELCQNELKLCKTKLENSEDVVKHTDNKSTAATLWRIFWCSLMTPILYDHVGTEKEDFMDVMIQYSGACKTTIHLIPDTVGDKVVNSSDDIEEPLTFNTSVKIKVKPDFAIYSKFGKPAGYLDVDKKQLFLIGRVKTTYHDYDGFNSQSDSEVDEIINSNSAACYIAQLRNTQKRASSSVNPSDGANESASKKPKTHGGDDVDHPVIIKSELPNSYTDDGDQTGKQCTNVDDGDQPGNYYRTGGGDDQLERQHNSDPSNNIKSEENKDEIRGIIKTQHFMELFGMLRHGMKDDDYRATRKMFGLYIVMNKVYITCLIPNTSRFKDPIRLGSFVMADTSSEFHDANAKERPFFLETIVLPPLNIFLPVHFKVFLHFLKFLAWAESRAISTSVP